MLIAKRYFSDALTADYVIVGAGTAGNNVLIYII